VKRPDVYLPSDAGFVVPGSEYPRLLGSSHASAIWAGVAFFRSAMSEQSSEGLIRFERLCVKRGACCGSSDAVETCVFIDLAGEETFAQRTVQHKADAEFLKWSYHSSPAFLVHSEYSL